MMNANETPAAELTNVVAATPATAPSGWYADPEQGGVERYWDGQRWTDHLRPTDASKLPAAPSQADVEAEAAARRAAVVPDPTVHEAQAAAVLPVAPSAPAAAAAPEPPVPVAPVPVAPAAAPAVVPTIPGAAPAPAQTSAVMGASWPCPGYAGPQPWQAEDPPPLTQDHLMLSPGASGPAVAHLGAMLGYLGYGSSVTSGQNPHAAYDASVVDAVQAFCRDYNVEEDPAIIRARTLDTVGPWIWQALTMAVAKRANETPATGVVGA